MKDILFLIVLSSMFVVAGYLLLSTVYKQKKTILTNTMECEKVFNGRTEVERCTDQNGDICYVTVYGISCNFKK